MKSHFSNVKRVIRNDEFIKALGMRVKSLRLEQNWSVNYLSVASGINRTQLHRLENGVINCNVSYLPALADAFGLSIPELLDFDYLSDNNGERITLM